MKIEFKTWEYLKEHGKEPKGRGLWYFTFEGNYLFTASGTLTEAKKKCREFVRLVAPKDWAETVYVNVEP